VDPRFAADGWRKKQNYVGQTLAPGHEKIHLIPPKPGRSDLDFLMQAWLQTVRGLASSPLVPPIAAAAVAAWTFVYFHPFEDGNGRIHRFLIHHLLARRGFTPEGVLLPVSAIMLNRPRDYDASLEAFSQPLLGRTDYDLDGNGRLAVNNDTLDLFRYIDCTPMAEALYDFATETILAELPRELSYIRCYDVARAAMRAVVDMPEPKANLFLSLCLQNNGQLSPGKRKRHFDFLSDDELSALESTILSAYQGHFTEPPSGVP
jgi:Fic/DOC family